MARWIVKALAQRTIGFMPNPDYWSDLVQRKIAGSVDLTYPFFLSRLDVARKNLEACARENSPAEVLELGTGWFPIVPRALRLAGAGARQALCTARGSGSQRSPRAAPACWRCAPPWRARSAAG